MHSAFVKTQNSLSSIAAVIIMSVKPGTGAKGDLKAIKKYIKRKYVYK